MRYWSKEAVLSDPRFPALEQERQQAAERLREDLCSVPFYAKKAAEAKAKGDEMAYWKTLQATEATLRRPSKASSAEATPPDQA